MTQRAQRFIDTYAETCSVIRAAEAAGVTKRQHYRWLEDPAYAKAFQQAERQAADMVEAELVRRGVEGWLEPVIYHGELCYQIEIKEDGEKVYTDRPLCIRKFSDQALITLVKAKKPDAYRDNAKVEHTGPEGGPLEITVRFVKPETER